MRLLPLLCAAALVVCVDTASAAPAPSWHPGSVPVLLGLENVRNDLGLTTAQRRKLDVIRSDFRRDAREIVASTLDPSVSRHEASAALASLRARANREAAAVLTPKQAARLREIEYQKLEGTMLTIPQVQTELGLSKAQIAKIQKGEGNLIRKANAINTAFEKGRFGPQERVDRLRELRLRTAESFVRILTPEQKQLLQQKKGAPLRAS